MSKIFWMAVTAVLVSGCGPLSPALSADLNKIETKADEACIVTALAADTNILNPVSDLVLVGAAYSCLVSAIALDAGTDGGASVDPMTALSLVAKHKPAAQALARSRAAMKMGGTLALPIVGVVAVDGGLR